MKYFFLTAFMFLGIQCEFFNTRHESKTMPSINLLLLDSATIFNPKSLPNKDLTVLIFFDPYCEYCGEETLSVMKNVDKFKNTQICFVSMASISDVRRFFSKCNLEKHSNVHVGIDTGMVYMRYFNIKGVPHTSVFTSDKILKKEFPFKVEAEQLLAEIDQVN